MRFSTTTWINLYRKFVFSIRARKKSHRLPGWHESSGYKYMTHEWGMWENFVFLSYEESIISQPKYVQLHNHPSKSQRCLPKQYQKSSSTLAKTRSRELHQLLIYSETGGNGSTYVLLRDLPRIGPVPGLTRIVICRSGLWTAGIEIVGLCRNRREPFYGPIITDFIILELLETSFCRNLCTTECAWGDAVVEKSPTPLETLNLKYSVVEYCLLWTAALDLIMYSRCLNIPLNRANRDFRYVAIIAIIAIDCFGLK